VVGVTRRGIGGTLLLAVVLAACGGGKSDGADSTSSESTKASDAVASTTTSAPATTTTLSPTDQVLAAYKAANDAAVATVNPPNPDDPRLAETHVGESLALVRSQRAQLRGVGGAIQSTYESHPTQPVIVGDKATFRDCYVDHSQQVSAKTGAPMGAPGQTVVNLDIEMQRVGGTWKLAKAQQRRDPCTP
jgi:hypothetical protein